MTELYKTLTTEMIADSKPDAFHTLFQHELMNVREKHGLDGKNSGQFTYAEGMTRKAARRIARNRARTRLRAIMADLDEQNYKEQQEFNNDAPNVSTLQSSQVATGAN